MNIQAMMKQAQKLQKDMMEEKNKIDSEIFEGKSSIVTVKVKGTKEIIEVKIDSEKIESDEIETLFSSKSIIGFLLIAHSLGIFISIVSEYIHSAFIL